MTKIPQFTKPITRSIQKLLLNQASQAELRRLAQRRRNSVPGGLQPLVYIQELKDYIGRYDFDKLGVVVSDQWVEAYIDLIKKIEYDRTDIEVNKFKLKSGFGAQIWTEINDHTNQETDAPYEINRTTIGNEVDSDVAKFFQDIFAVLTQQRAFANTVNAPPSNGDWDSYQSTLNSYFQHSGHPGFFDSSAKLHSALLRRIHEKSVGSSERNTCENDYYHVGMEPLFDALW